VKGKGLARFVLVSVVVVLLLGGLAGTARAAEFRSGERVIIAADEVIDDDLFLSGAYVEVRGTVNGDLFATGQEVIVTGEVGGSLMIAGRTLEVNGSIGGSVYSGGYALTVGPEADIARNLYFGGYSLTAERGGAVGRSLYASGYQLLLDGAVANDVLVGAGALELNGSVGGDVRGEVSEGDGAPAFMPEFPGAVVPIPPGYRQGEGAEVGGQVDIKRVREADRRADRGGRGPGRVIMCGLRGIWRRVGEFLALLIVGGLLLYFVPDWVRRVGAPVREQPLPSTGWGLVVLVLFWIAVPVAVALLLVLSGILGLVTLGQLFGSMFGLGGALLAVAISLVSIVTDYAAKVIVAFVVGQLVLERLAPETQNGSAGKAWALVAGVFAYEIIRAIPILGWLVGVVVTLCGLGALFLVLRGIVQPPAAPSATEEVAVKVE
jgi:hypothetical protein